jgi:Tfp pilus assembly protein PilX
MNRILVCLIPILLLTLSTEAKEYPRKADSTKKSQSEIKGLTAGCQLGKTVTQISLNNASTWVHMDGILWTDITGGNAGYEIPKGSGKTSLYSGGIWIGGTDVNGQLKLSAVIFKGDRN